LFTQTKFNIAAKERKHYVNTYVDVTTDLNICLCKSCREINCTLHVSYTIFVSQNIRTNKGERTNRNKKTVCIFVKYELGIWYFLLIYTINTTRNWSTKTRSIMCHASYISYDIGSQHKLMTPKSFFLNSLTSL
jgi:hypothetical protein